MKGRAPLTLEPAAEFPGQSINAGNASAADRYGDALIAKFIDGQCQPLQNLR